MKKMYVVMALLFGFLAGGAQTNNPRETRNDPDAKKVLDAVSAKFRTFKSPQAAFTYQVENAQGKVLSSRKGTVNMKGNKYKVNMGGLEIFSDGRTSWNYDKNANEVTVSGVDLNGTAMTPQRLFTNFYDRDFFYKMNGEKKVAGKTVQEVELTPTDKTKPFHKVYVLVDKAAKTIYSARFLEKSGNRYSYTINALNPNASVTDAAFVFDQKKYPGVEIVDLR